MYVQRNIEALSRIIVAVEKNKLLYIFLCVFVALFIQHAKRVRCLILSTVAYLNVQHVSTLSHIPYNFRKMNFV
jgi:hypothetical protein